jgi:hypothetical protein
VARLAILDHDRRHHRRQRIARLGGGGAGAFPVSGAGGRGGEPLAGLAAFPGSPDDPRGAVGQDEQPGDEQDDDYQNHVHEHQGSGRRERTVEHIRRRGL